MGAGRQEATFASGLGVRMAESKDWVQRLNQLMEGTLHEQVRGLVRETKDGFERFAAELAAQAQQVAQSTDSIARALEEMRAQVDVVASRAQAFEQADALQRDTEAAIRKEVASVAEGVRDGVASELDRVLEQIGGRLGSLEGKIGDLDTFALQIDGRIEALGEQFYGRLEAITDRLEGATLGGGGGGSTEDVGRVVEHVVASARDAFAADLDRYLGDLTDNLRVAFDDLRHQVDGVAVRAESLDRESEGLRQETETIREQAVAGIRAELTSTVESLLEQMTSDLERALWQFGDRISSLEERLEAMSGYLGIQAAVEQTSARESTGRPQGGGPSDPRPGFDPGPGPRPGLEASPGG